MYNCRLVGNYGVLVSSILLTVEEIVFLHRNSTVRPVLLSSEGSGKALQLMTALRVYI